MTTKRTTITSRILSTAVVTGLIALSAVWTAGSSAAAEPGHLQTASTGSADSAVYPHGSPNPANNAFGSIDLIVLVQDNSGACQTFGSCDVPGGTVDIAVDGSFLHSVDLAGCNVESSCADYVTAGIGPGSHTITFTYSGDGTFAPSSGSYVQVVNTVGTSTSLTQPSTTSGLGFSVGFTVTVTSDDPTTPTPTGQVQFFLDGSVDGGPVTLSGGKVTLTFVPPTGVHSLSATYLGDTNYDGSLSNLLSHTVLTGGSFTDLSSTPNSSACQQSVLFEATVSNVFFLGGQPTGTVAFFDGATLLGTAPIVGGLADLSTTSLAVGSHVMTATYAGDTNFDGSTSLPLTQVVNACVVPVAVDDSYTTAHDTALTIADPGVLGNDSVPVGDGVAQQSAPAHGTLTLNPVGGFSYTPTTGFSGVDTFTYCVSGDPDLIQCASTVATVTITVAAPPPVAVADSYTTSEGTALTLPAPGVLTNDLGLGSGDHAGFLTAPAHGTLTLPGFGDAGNFTYTPTAGYTGTDTFTYCISSASTCDSNTVTVSVAVTPAPPVAVNDSYTTAHGAELSVADPGLLSNDTNVDSSSDVVIATTTPTHGSIVILNYAGGLRYLPDSGYSGPDTFSYCVADAGHTCLSNIATVTITTAAAVPGPTAINDSYTTMQNTQLSMIVPGVMANDIDHSGTGIGVVAHTAPTSGTVSIANDGSFTYTPNTGFTGTDSFTYTISDDLGAHATATVTIAVNAPTSSSSPPPSPTTSASTPHSPTPVTSTTGGVGALAATGTNWAALVVLGIALLAAGAGVLLAISRRSGHAEHS